MKKRTLTLLVCTLCVASVAVGAVAENAVKEYRRFRTERPTYTKQHKQKDAPAHTNGISVTSPEKPALIDKETAKSKALEHTGFSAYDVKRISAELDFDKGVWEYEVEFKHSGFEYEVDINAETGEVLKSKKEFDD